MGSNIIISGLPASPGTCRAVAWVIHPMGGDAATPGAPRYALVTAFATPFIYRYLIEANALITDLGGVTSHAAQLARMLGIPCVVGTGRATTLLKNGMDIMVNGDRGVVSEVKR